MPVFFRPMSKLSGGYCERMHAKSIFSQPLPVFGGSSNVWYQKKHFANRPVAFIFATEQLLIQ